jgi:hypothetical protein
MNYTNPNDPEHEDSPADWLGSVLVMTRALSLILKEDEGIVVKLENDAKKLLKTDKVIVYNSENMVRIMQLDEDLEEGTWVMMKEEENE